MNLTIHLRLVKQTPWPESVRELYRPSDRRLLAKLAPTFADREFHVFSVTDPYARILGFLDRSPTCVAEVDVAAALMARC
jgi:hypothetical protein